MFTIIFLHIDIQKKHHKNRYYCKNTVIVFFVYSRFYFLQRLFFQLYTSNRAVELEQVFFRYHWDSITFFTTLCIFVLFSTFYITFWSSKKSWKFQSNFLESLWVQIFLSYQRTYFWWKILSNFWFNLKFCISGYP